mgnify:FL=1
MPTNFQNDAQSPDEMTIPSRLAPADSESPVELTRPFASSRPISTAPWLLQQHYNGRINLTDELTLRYPSLPLLTIVKLRKGKGMEQPALASLSAPDGTASLLVEAQPGSRIVDFAYTFGSMLTMRFRLSDLSHMDCTHWLELTRRDQDGVAFLWGKSRWEKDYLICTIRRQFVSLYAFSSQGFESGVRLTHDAKGQVHDWLHVLWSADLPPDTSPQLTTW